MNAGKAPSGARANHSLGGGGEPSDAHVAANLFRVCVMSKNPVFEYLRQGGHVQADDEPTLVGRRAEPRTSRFAQAPFTYAAVTLLGDDAILRTLRACPHPNVVLVDSSLFSVSRLDLCRLLLIERPLHTIAEARAELSELRDHQSRELRELVLPGGQLNPRLVDLPDRMLPGHPRVATKLTNLLHFRKRLLEKPIKEFEEAHGRSPAGKERSKIANDLLRNGVSWRTLRLATKGDPARRYTDETLVVSAVLGPILMGRDVFLLTADQDVFDQFFQLTQLIFGDYGSFLIGEDFRRRPDRYRHQHPTSTPAMEADAIAVGRDYESHYLLPSTAAHATCASWVIDVGTGRCMAWVSTRDVARALRFQETTDRGRVADGGDGRNVQIQLFDTTCKAAERHFTVGRDILAVDVPTEVGQLCITRHDLTRIVADGPLGDRTSTRIVMPGLPSARGRP